MENATTTIINTILANTQMNADEVYIGDDGRVHCRKCHGFRDTEKVIEAFGQRMPVWCDCMKEAKRKEEEKAKYERKMQRLDELRSASLLGERYKNTTFETTDLDRPDDFVKAFHRCEKYCEIINTALQNGYGMYLYGDSGTGKSHLTACICNKLITEYQQCLFTNFFEISRMIRQTFNKSSTDAETIIKRICEIDFLFIDDLGTEKLQKNGEDNWLQEQVFDIINKRYNNKKPTIFSSNYSLNELITDRGMMQKTVERINEMSTAIIKLSGSSYRMKNKPKNAPF